MPQYYIIFSPHSQYYSRVERILLEHVRTIPGRLILVKEYGSDPNKVHEHLNLVYFSKSSDKNINRTWRRIFDNIDPNILRYNHRLIHISTVFDYEKLVKGYLNKEKRREILYSRYITCDDESRRNAFEAKRLLNLTRKIWLSLDMYVDTQKDPEPFDLNKYMQEFKMNT